MGIPYETMSCICSEQFWDNIVIKLQWIVIIILPICLL